MKVQYPSDDWDLFVGVLWGLFWIWYIVCVCGLISFVVEFVNCIYDKKRRAVYVNCVRDFLRELTVVLRFAKWKEVADESEVYESFSYKQIP